MKVTASENLKRALAPLKPHQIYLGRYLLFLVLGLIQSGLICLGICISLESSVSIRFCSFWQAG